MGYVVLHIEKAAGTDAAMSGHVERRITPANVITTLTYLNEELVEFPKGVTNRTEAIQHRLDNAGLERKIGKNQVRALRVMLSGSPEDMKRIRQAGQLDAWAKDSCGWLQKTFGKENVVSAVLHLDEKTPHIHATVVPITRGERRKAKLEREKNAQSGKTKVFRNTSSGATKASRERPAQKASRSFRGRQLGKLPEWPNGADCKSAGLRLRWFESITSH